MSSGCQQGENWDAGENSASGGHFVHLHPQSRSTENRREGCPHRTWAQRQMHKAIHTDSSTPPLRHGSRCWGRRSKRSNSKSVRALGASPLCAGRRRFTQFSQLCEAVSTPQVRSLSDWQRD